MSVEAPTRVYISADGSYIIEKSMMDDAGWSSLPNGNEIITAGDIDYVLIDADANGNSITGDSQQALGASADGRYILFKLDEYGDVDLTPGDAYSPGPLYRKDIQTGSVKYCGLMPCLMAQPSLQMCSSQTATFKTQKISLDGQVVVFREPMTPDFVVIRRSNF